MSRLDVYLDHNVWDLIKECSLDLRSDFPSDQFALVITREAEFEIDLTPQPLKDFNDENFVRLLKVVREGT